MIRVCFHNWYIIEFNFLFLVVIAQMSRSQNKEGEQHKNSPIDVKLILHYANNILNIIQNLIYSNSLIYLYDQIYKSKIYIITRIKNAQSHLNLSRHKPFFKFIAQNNRMFIVIHKAPFWSARWPQWRKQYIIWILLELTVFFPLEFFF